MNNSGRFLVAALLCAFAVYWYVRRSREEDAAARPTAIDASVPVADSHAPPAPGDPPPERFRKIDPAARRAIVERLAATRAARERDHAAAALGTAPPAPGTAPPAPLPGTLSVDNVVEGVSALIPLFKDCYDQTRAHRSVTNVRVDFNLQLSGEADVGTLVDSIELDGDEAFRADPEFATCLRETMLAVELPPMAGGSRAMFRTAISFADEEPEAADAGP